MQSTAYYGAYRKEKREPPAAAATYPASQSEGVGDIESSRVQFIPCSTVYKGTTAAALSENTAPCYLLRTPLHGRPPVRSEQNSNSPAITPIASIHRHPPAHNGHGAQARVARSGPRQARHAGQATGGAGVSNAAHARWEEERARARLTRLASLHFAGFKPKADSGEWKMGGESSFFLFAALLTGQDKTRQAPGG